MKKFFAILIKTLEGGKDTMVVSVSAASGSVPRGAGAKMLVTEDGRIFGTIGGGSVEHEATQRAMALLKEKLSGLQSFQLAPNKVKDLGMVCGGNVSIYFQYISADNSFVKELAALALDKIKNGEESWLITDVTDAAGGQMGLYSEKDGGFGIDGLSDITFSDAVHKQNKNGREYFIEPLVRAGTLYIFGGGHVSQALVPVAAGVGFRCVVIDDRDEFTNPMLFPEAEKTIKLDLSGTTRLVNITKNDYIAIMTRGHRHDAALQAWAMRTDALYIGVIGSKSKILHVSNQMRELGFTDADLARIKTPIGLDIKAETPEEIAISIVAELIMVRAEASL